jgi:hypothetical protein
MACATLVGTERVGVVQDPRIIASQQNASMTLRKGRGDFNADGFVDGPDFGNWNAMKFTRSDHECQRLATPRKDRFRDFIFAAISLRPSEIYTISPNGLR